MSRKKQKKSWSQMRELADRQICDEIVHFIEVIRDSNLIDDTIPKNWIEDNETPIPSLESAIASLGPLQRKAVEVFFFGFNEEFDSTEQTLSAKFHALRNLRSQSREARTSESSDSTCIE